jgi:quercetin dioxygenase-like cupin family protein
MKRILIISTVLIALGGLALADHGAKKDMGLFPPDAIQWMDVPNALPPGAKLAVLEGNPFGEGMYTMRLSMPAGYRIPPHYHKKYERVTVISGTFHLGMGDKFDQSTAAAMPAGTFGYLGPNMNHYAFASEPTVIQLHGDGPWGIYYLDPKTDPRNAK